MTTFRASTLALALLAGPALAQQPPPAPAAPAPQPQAAAESAWPRPVVDGDLTFWVYQPQLDSWENDRLSARQAVAVQRKGEEAKSYGVVWLTARTDVDKEAGRVRLYELRIPKASFPGDEKSAPAWQAALQKQLLGEMDLSLERLQMALAVATAEKTRKGLKVRNDPPVILFRERPAMLVYVDGKAALRPLENTGLERVINTRPLVVRDPASGRFYLRLLDGWMEAQALEGPWRIAQSPPAALGAALAWGQKNDKLVDLLVAKPVEVDPAEAEGAEKVEPPSLAKGQAPEIIVAHQATELVVTDGPPNLAPIEKTSLLYWTNTRSDVLVDSASGQTFVLLSGRFFSARTTAGPWSFVPSDKLPADFAKIPDDGPKANVLASVAGTPQSQEALIANSIPQTATVKKSEAKFTASYDGGTPKLQAIEGTSLQYAVNSPAPVILVSPQWYACVNGVWFVAQGAAGPWVVATSVPAAIYGIPPSSPLHYVTYVKVYGSTADTVSVGYTPGYMGTVATTTVVVYGTGYYYPPYIGPTVWYGPPVTFGFGVHVGWSPWTGWHMGFGFGFYAPGFSIGFGVGPWWGPMPIYRPPFYPVYRPPYPGYRPPYPGYRPPYGGYPGYPGYRPPGATAPAPPPGAARPPGGTAPAPPPAGGRPSTGTPRPPASINGGNVYGQWGGAATRPATRPSTPSAGTLPAGGGARPSTGDVYAGRDGNVYRPSQGGGWEKHGAGGWQSAPKAQPQMNREQSARQWGDYRSAPSQPSARPSSPAPTSYRGGGGGYRGGGGGRGGGRR